MKRTLLIKLPTICLALTALLSTARGGIPSMDVTVFDAKEKVVFKQAINSDASFATGNLRPGNYVVQFNTNSRAVKNNHYLAVVSSGRKKVIAASVPGESFMARGAAVRIDVGPGMKITGQVAKEEAMSQLDGPMFRVVDGKRYLWVGPQTGTNIAGQWVEQTLAPARNTIVWTSEELRKRIDRGGEGSMITNHHYYSLPTKGY